MKDLKIEILYIVWENIHVMITKKGVQKYTQLPLNKFEEWLNFNNRLVLKMIAPEGDSFDTDMDLEEYWKLGKEEHEKDLIDFVIEHGYDVQLFGSEVKPTLLEERKALEQQKESLIECLNDFLNYGYESISGGKESKDIHNRARLLLKQIGK